MTQPWNSPRKALLALLTLLLLGGAERAAAAGLAFRNDLNIPVVVQGASIINGMVRRGQPLLIPPGRTAYDANLPPGNRQITILDANQPNRVLHNETLLFIGQDRLISIRANPAAPLPPLVLIPQ